MQSIRQDSGAQWYSMEMSLVRSICERTTQQKLLSSGGRIKMKKPLLHLQRLLGLLFSESLHSLSLSLQTNAGQNKQTNKAANKPRSWCSLEVWYCCTFFIPFLSTEQQEQKRHCVSIKITSLCNCYTGM